VLLLLHFVSRHHHKCRCTVEIVFSTSFLFNVNLYLYTTRACIGCVRRKGAVQISLNWSEEMNVIYTCSNYGEVCLLSESCGKTVTITDIGSHIIHNLKNSASAYCICVESHELAADLGKGSEWNGYFYV
jgi:hypothetical protein